MPLDDSTLRIPHVKRSCVGSLKWGNKGVLFVPREKRERSELLILLGDVGSADWLWGA